MLSEQAGKKYCDRLLMKYPVSLPLAVPKLMRWTLGILISLCIASAMAQQTASQWVWYPEQPASDCVRQNRWFRRTFELPDKPQQASLWLLVDDSQQLWVNGQGPLSPVQSGEDSQRYDLTLLLQPGRNAIAVLGWNDVGPAGVIARLVATLPNGHELTFNSDSTWRAAKTQPPAEWINAAYDDTQWAPVRIIGNAFTLPWYNIPRFNMTPFISAAEMQARQKYIESLLAPAEQFAAEKPARARIAPYNGAPALFIDGQPRPLVMYRGIVDPFSEYGRHVLATFRDAGIHGYAPSIDQFWTGPGKYNWQSADEMVRAYLSVDPAAYLDILVGLIPPRWWFQAHPDEMVAYATSDQIDSGDEAARVLRPSPASEHWRKDVGEAWTALIRHMETQPWGKRVIGWHACYGLYGEWHYFGSWTQQYPDTGPAMTRTFRAYLRSTYGDVEKLRAAWHDRQVTFDTAQVPGVKPRQFSALLAFRDPQTEQAAIDYYRCQHKVTADAIEYFGKLAKDASAGRAIYGIYYGYFMSVVPQSQGGHLDLLRLLKSPYIDYFVAPYDYGNRLMGMDGRLRSLANVFNLSGKANIIEADTRTYLHPVNESGRTQDLTESLAAIRREFSTGLIEHTGYWYVDFGPETGVGWYDEPHIMATIKDLYKLAERALQTPRKSVAEVALVCDLDSAYYLSDGEGMLTAYNLIMDTTRELYRVGAPFDAFLLPQLEQADLSQYKVLIFLNTTAMSDRQAQWVKTLRDSGKFATVFLWAPGLTGPDGISVDRVKAVTGFTVKLEPCNVPGKMLVTDLASPLAQGLPVTETGTNKVSRFGGGTFGPLVTPVVEPGTTVLGHVEGRADGLLAMRGRGKNIAVFCPAPYLPREILANVLREAGVHRYDNDLQDVLRADSRYLAIHTKAGGQRTLALPRAGTVTDAISGQALGTGTAVPLTLATNSTTILELPR